MPLPTANSLIQNVDFSFFNSKNGKKFPRILFSSNGGNHSQALTVAATTYDVVVDVVDVATAIVALGAKVLSLLVLLFLYLLLTLMLLLICCFCCIRSCCGRCC